MFNWLNDIIANFFDWLWQWTVILVYWFTMLSTVIAVIFYCVTANRKNLQYIGIIIVIYTLIKGVDLVL